MLVYVIGAMMMIMAIIIIVALREWMEFMQDTHLALLDMYVWCKNWSGGGGASPFRPLNETEMSDCVTSQVPAFLSLSLTHSSAAVDWLIGRVVRNYDGSGMHAYLNWRLALAQLEFLSLALSSGWSMQILLNNKLELNALRVLLLPSKSWKDSVAVAGIMRYLMVEKETSFENLCRLRTIMPEVL